MSAHDDGGPAFPQLGTTWDDEAGEYVLDQSLDGMSLRDYFAAKALPVVASGHHEVGQRFLRLANFEFAAADAYRMADAMLKAREA